MNVIEDQDQGTCARPCLHQGVHSLQNRMAQHRRLQVFDALGVVAARLDAKQGGNEGRAGRRQRRQARLQIGIDQIGISARQSKRPAQEVAQGGKGRGGLVRERAPFEPEDFARVAAVANQCRQRPAHFGHEA